MKLTTILPGLAALCATTLAQTFTDCNPLNATCPPNTALGRSNYTIDFLQNEMNSKVWNWTAGSAQYGSDGAEFIISTRGDAPTVKSKFYIFFGTVEVIFRAAKGQGIVSSIVIQSDDLDEIDWEWIGGNDTHVQTNYFGKGNTTSYDRAEWVAVDSPLDEFHNYTTDWSKEKIDFYIDGNIVRTIKYEDANGGNNFPQTPSDVRLGIWAGGDKNNNNYTIEWAGGEVNYKDAPYTMYVKSLRITDAAAGQGTQYEYGDNSGSFDSIKILNNTAAIKLDGNDGESMVKRWQGLSETAKIAIGASVCGVALIAAIIFVFCCIKQRRAGKHERLLEDAKFEKDRAELLAFRAEMGRQRSEKLAMMQGAPTGQVHPSGIHSMNSGRGYQRY
ncbi:hypothetical protein LTR70_006210 [Exophiala xenobiotica]|uniref:chitinase n=1 Tax=Lithohypha guttulata TaxID=1690604 RepID=A0ABR0K3I1_9EURO|nr:hypothetical protein LTR24_007338 [Lithohypha guttulata]KAK5316551.1 hypothetical protein LTR70_006210 [Exophiala xenobiotica]